MNKKIFTLCLLAAGFIHLSASDSFPPLYFHLSGGYADINYYSEYDRDKIDLLVDEGPGLDVTHIPYTLELALYVEVSRGTLIGLAYNVSNDYQKLNYNTPLYKGNDEIHLGLSMATISAQYFLGKKAAQGPFFRIDTGISRYHSIENYTEFDYSNWGLTQGGGFGYAFNIGKTSLVIAGNIFYGVFVGDIDFLTLSFTTGILL